MTRGHCAVSFTKLESSGWMTTKSCRFLESTLQVEDVLNTAVTGDIDQHVRNGNQQEIRRHGNRIRYGAVE